MADKKTDGEILIGTKIDTDGVEEGVKKLKEEFQNWSKSTTESAEKIKESLSDVGESVKQESEEAQKAIHEMVSDLPESYRTVYEKIERLRSDDASDQKDKVKEISELYELLGQTHEQAVKEAWKAVKNDTEDGSRKVIENLKDIANQAKETGSQMGSNLSGSLVSNALGGLVGGITSSLATKAMDILADAGRAVVEFGKESLELGSDLQEVQNVVDVTFTTMSDKVDEFAQNAAVTAGLSETMAKQYVGTYGAMADAFDFTEAEAFEMSTTLAQLAGDVASFYNLDQDEAFTKLKSVFTGETEALKDLG